MIITWVEPPGRTVVFSVQSETISATTKHLAWDTAESLPLLLYDGTNYYVYGPEGLPIEQIASETSTYLHHDAAGSTRLLTAQAGTTTGAYTFTPFGQTPEGTSGHTGAATSNLLYDGQYTSPDTGLIYLRARVYDPGTAQFMSVDPIVSATGAPYFYAGDNPVNWGDPSGLCAGPESWECAFAKASVFTAQVAIGASLGTLVTAAIAAAALPPSAPITVPAAAVAAGISAAAYGALVLAYRWEASACKPA